MKYRVSALVTGSIYKEIEAESEEEAKEIMLDKYGDQEIHLCSYCAGKVSGLVVSEDTDSYEVEEMGLKV